MPVTRDDEFEPLKTGIGLRGYAASPGYALDRKESWRGSSVMRSPTGDKVAAWTSLTRPARTFHNSLIYQHFQRDNRPAEPAPAIPASYKPFILNNFYFHKKMR